jgi:3-deoxy-D-manno-octulosonic-acid transferase
MLIYNLILYIISPYLVSRVIIEAIRRKSGFSFIKQRLGLISKKLHNKPIWIHASSVGETKAAVSLYQSLSKNSPEERFLITTNTSSSRSIIPINENLEHLYLPLDWLFTTKRFINSINPRICILIETELWPNLISICKKNNISIIIANARLSKKTTGSPSFIKNIYKKVLSNIDLILCKSNRDKESYIQLGYLDKNIKVIGNLKYADTNNTIYNNENIVNRKYVLALSTHPDEERQIITEWMRINEKKTLLVIMPRHPERLGDILSDIPLDLLSISIRSKNEPIKKSTQIYIADTFGEADIFLEHCEFVFLGGSLIDHGGQNFMEAASYGKTIIVGPYMYNFIEETEEFLKNNAMIMVKSSPTLKHVFERLIKSKQRRELFGANAKKILLSKKNIIDDYCKEIQSLL